MDAQTKADAIDSTNRRIDRLKIELDQDLRGTSDGKTDFAQWVDDNGVGMTIEDQVRAYAQALVAAQKRIRDLQQSLGKLNQEPVV